MIPPPAPLPETTAGSCSVPVWLWRASWLWPGDASGRLGGLVGCLADMAGALAGWLVACGPALGGPAHGQRMCCLLDERFPRLLERAVILLGQELAATTFFLATTGASLTIDVTTDCGLITQVRGLMVTRLMHCMERVHWCAPALAHDSVDASLLVGGELKRHRPKWEGCGASSSQVLPPQSLPLEPT